ncbi:hypothetical protein KWF86_11455 [Acinetobacter pittii]|nr:hypothetical protein [Acinetobacter pittii]MCE6001864.1 hypothetical protein [Acinetobacter pittii]MCE6629387.1 hypothetical protein [Acinetobacter pittii]
MWTYGWGFTTNQLEQALKEVDVNTLANFDLAEAIARSEKLRGRYNRSGLSNTDYNELLRLEKAVEEARKEQDEVKVIPTQIKEKAGDNMLWLHKPTSTYYMTDSSIYLYYWNDDLQDWDDSDYTIKDSFFGELDAL